MFLILLLALLYATLSSACVFPFNNPRLTNASLVADYAADLQTKYGNGGEHGGGNGWATVIGAGTTDMLAWPDNSKSGTKLVNIYYCFASHKDFTDLKDIDALGDPFHNGHRFDGFHHFYDKSTNSHPRCYRGNTNTGERIWNREVPEGTLVIESRAPESGSWATLGYLDKTMNSDPDRHTLTIGSKGYGAYWPAEVAHELGHVLGLVHEHQRKDRDNFINFDCSKLLGYDEAKAEIESHSEWGISIDEVCKSNNLGFTHGLDFMAPTQYTLDMGSGRVQSSGSSYDHDSIMQYSSVALAKNGQTKAVKDLPIVRWKNGRPQDGLVDDSNAQFIYINTEPSDGDKEGVQRLYPWIGW
ncbi:hypothetical protein G6011_02885 [Alternaria panax]|uniref:Metalloendopeptidase n=1 Tax=Alternaria panax TaxID=48097 RepID=A0AAD4I833_9PLEO|nr:hypothetical protein G6011_02885 [Alternaria panax]